ncbi:MAG TPA: LytR C-terminal domain-containing protein [Balneolales bacterium]|nr:LytR C-terminal domain-containing protein [Balneolales bacterium]
MAAKNSSNFALNAVIGFLSLLLAFLLIALVTRIVYPRIQNERASNQKNLIGKVIQIEVLNGCGVQGLANRFTNRLRQDGFDVVHSGNFETFDITHSMVIDRSGNMQNARRVAHALGINKKNIIQEISPNYYLDATVVIGSDYEKLK